MKRKNLLLGLGTLTAIATPIVAVVSCGTEDKTNEENKGTENETVQDNGNAVVGENQNGVDNGNGSNGDASNGDDQNAGNANGGSRPASNAGSSDDVDLSADWQVTDGHEVGNNHFWVPSTDWTVGGHPVAQEYTKMFNVADDYLTGNVIGRMRTFENKENSLMVSGASGFDMNVVAENLQGLRDFITAGKARGSRFVFTERVNGFDADHYVLVAPDTKHPEFTWYMAEVDGYGAPVNNGVQASSTSGAGQPWSADLVATFGQYSDVPATYTAGGVATPGSWVKAFVPNTDASSDKLGEYFYRSDSMTQVFTESYTGEKGEHDNVVTAAEETAVRALIAKATSANHLMAVVEQQGANLDSIPADYKTHMFSSTAGNGNTYEWFLVELDQSSSGGSGSTGTPSTSGTGSTNTGSTGASSADSTAGLPSAWTAEIVAEFPDNYQNVPTTYMAGGVPTTGDYSKAFVPSTNPNDNTFGQYYYSSSSLTPVYSSSYSGPTGEHYDTTVASEEAEISAFIARVQAAGHLLIATSNLNGNTPEDHYTHFFDHVSGNGQTHEWFLVEIDGYGQPAAGGAMTSSVVPTHATVAGLPTTIAELKQAYPSYYGSLSDDATGQELFDQISAIQHQHTNHGMTYGGLYRLYHTAFRDNSFDGDGSIVDLFGETDGRDPYQSTQENHGSSGGVGVSYNREHVVPKSAWGGDHSSPNMPGTDGHVVWPGDTHLNSRRGTTPYGDSHGGSMEGSTRYGSNVEVDDVMKGDVARLHMYFAATWGELVHGYAPIDMHGRGGLSSSYQQTYMDWVTLDPVDEFDVQRNDAIANAERGLRNPFVDFPGLAELIYGSGVYTAPDGSSFDLASVQSHSGTGTSAAGSNTGTNNAPASVSGGWTAQVVSGFGTQHDNLPTSYTSGGQPTPGDFTKAFIPSSDRTNGVLGTYFWASDSQNAVYLSGSTASHGQYDNEVTGDAAALEALIAHAIANHKLMAISSQDSARNMQGAVLAFTKSQHDWYLFELDATTDGSTTSVAPTTGTNQGTPAPVSRPVVSTGSTGTDSSNPAPVSVGAGQIALADVVYEYIAQTIGRGRGSAVEQAWSSIITSSTKEDFISATVAAAGYHDANQGAENVQNWLDAYQAAHHTTVVFGATSTGAPSGNNGQGVQAPAAVVGTGSTDLTSGPTDIYSAPATVDTPAPAAGGEQAIDLPVEPTAPTIDDIVVDVTGHENDVIVTPADWDFRDINSNRFDLHGTSYTSGGEELPVYTRLFNPNDDVTLDVIGEYQYDRSGKGNVYATEDHSSDEPTAFTLDSATDLAAVRTFIQDVQSRGHLIGLAVDLAGTSIPADHYIELGDKAGHTYFFIEIDAHNGVEIASTTQTWEEVERERLYSEAVNQYNQDHRVWQTQVDEIHATSTVPMHANLNGMPQSVAELKAAYPHYYGSLTDGATGQQLFDEIVSIQHSHRNHGMTYSGLYGLYRRAFADNFFDNDGSIVDLFGETDGRDPYQSTTENHNGNGSRPGDTYNREHVIPKSAWGGSTSTGGPGSDGHNVWPSDTSLNSKRGVTPYGDAHGGTLRGSARYGSNVEVDDLLKGDVARAHMYFAATWGDRASGYAPLSPNSLGGLSSSYRTTYMRWVTLDPVDGFDVQRNNVIAQAEHGLRNPFVDFPGLADLIYTGSYTPSTSTHSSTGSGSSVHVSNPAPVSAPATTGSSTGTSAGATGTTPLSSITEFEPISGTIGNGHNDEIAQAWPQIMQSHSRDEFLTAILAVAYGGRDLDNAERWLAAYESAHGTTVTFS